jgi:hypothetical protein
VAKFQDELAITRSPFVNHVMEFSDVIRAEIIQQTQPIHLLMA